MKQTLTELLQSYDNKKLCKTHDLLHQTFAEMDDDTKLPQELADFFQPRHYSTGNPYSGYKLLHAMKRIERIMISRFMDENL